MSSSLDTVSSKLEDVKGSVDALVAALSYNTFHPVRRRRHGQAWKVLCYRQPGGHTGHAVAALLPELTACLACCCTPSPPPASSGLPCLECGQLLHA